MPEAMLTSEPDGAGVRIQLQMGGRRSKVPVSQWSGLPPASAGALSTCLSVAEDGAIGSNGVPLVSTDEEAVRLHPEYVAALNSNNATALGLPPPTVLAIDLQSDGLITEPGFRINARWVRPGGAPARATVSGALITHDGATRRIPQPLFDIWRAAAKLGGELDTADRFGALADLRRALPDDARAAVSANGYLEDLRVHYASGFSLKIGGDGPFTFDPVLFGKVATGEAQQGALLDEDADSVLAPAAQRLFAEDRFRRWGEARAAYVLRDGEYVFIDPALRPALGVVRRLQDASEAERRKFVTNPRRAIREALGNEADEGIDQLFIETEQFSRRVAGVDVWRTPVLPWLKQTPHTWLPEQFGLRIGDDYVQVPSEAVEPLTKAVAEAIENGEPQATASGITVPATAQTQEALSSLSPFIRKDVIDGGVQEEAPPFTGAGERMFLLVEENFEEVRYAPFEPANRTPLQEVSPPARVRTALKPHQLSGLNWLASSISAGLPGVLLADDMGLGKTLQAIAFMAWLQEEARAGRRPQRPFLIVAPTGLLANWRDEIERHLDAQGLGELVLAFGANLKALREEDALSARDIDTGRAALQSEAWRSAGVVLTTYETMRDYHFSFARTRFGAIVFDEIQKLKNPTSQLTRAAKTLNADFTVGMTGTPVENRLQDLWSLMDVISPGLLGSSREFEGRYPPHDVAELQRLRVMLTEPQQARPPYMLRRLKADHLPGLPQKIVRAERLPMPPAQANAYREIVRSAVASRANLSSTGGMLQVLHAMRGVSLHPVAPDQAPPDLEAYANNSPA